MNFVAEAFPVVVEVNGKEVRIEVNDKCHFVGSKQLGSTVLKRRHLAFVERLSYVTVHYWDWNELRNITMKQNYLRSLLFQRANCNV